MTAEPAPRPRVEGARESEILEATLATLAEVGYDRLTMDAVAQRAHASKATLYRRWQNKQCLVIESLENLKEVGQIPDTGSLREDLMEFYGCTGGLADPAVVATLASVVTAIAHDPEFATAFRERVLAHKVAATAVIYRRAIERGEIRPDVDLGLAAPALPGIVLHRYFLFAELPDREAIGRVLDELILPALAPAERRPPG